MIDKEGFDESNPYGFCRYPGRVLDAAPTTGIIQGEHPPAFRLADSGSAKGIGFDESNPYTRNGSGTGCKTDRFKTCPYVRKLSFCFGREHRAPTSCLRLGHWNLELGIYLEFGACDL